MADESMDPCECIWNHELAMRRLLSLLRHGQAYCTDSECLEELPGMGGNGSFDNILLMGLLVVFGLILYVMRPRSTQRVNDKKVLFNSQGPSGNSPPPPPPAAPSN